MGDPTDMNEILKCMNEEFQLSYVHMDIDNDQFFANFLREMEVVGVDQKRVHNGKLSKYMLFVSNIFHQYIKKLGELRSGMTFMNNPENFTLEDMVRLTREFITKQKCINIGKHIKRLEAMYRIWEKYRAYSQYFDEEQKEGMITVLQQLATLCFIHGENHKGLLCMIDYMDIAEEFSDDNWEAIEIEMFKWLFFYQEINFAISKMPTGEISQFLHAISLYPHMHNAAEIPNVITTLLDVRAATVKFIKEGKQDEASIIDLNSPWTIDWLLWELLKYNDFCTFQSPPATFRNVPKSLLAEVFDTIREPDNRFAFRTLNIYYMNIGFDFSLRYSSDFSHAIETLRRFALFQTTGSNPRKAHSLLLALWYNTVMLGSPFQVLKMVKEMLHHVLRRKDDNWEEKADILRDLIQQILNMDGPDHRKDESCSCAHCAMYYFSEEYASEYLSARAASLKFSKDAMTRFYAEFCILRKRDESSWKNDKIKWESNKHRYTNFEITIQLWKDNIVMQYFNRDQNNNLYRLLMASREQTALHQLPLFFIRQQLNEAYHSGDIVLEFPWMMLPENVKRNWKRSKQILTERILMNPTSELMEREYVFRKYAYQGRKRNYDSWETAHGFVESTAIGLRMRMRENLGERGLHGAMNLEEFKSKVKSMPDNMTVVQIAMADNGDVYMIKLHSKRYPIVIPLMNKFQLKKLRSDTKMLTKCENIETSPKDGDHKKVMDSMARLRIEEERQNIEDKFEKEYLNCFAQLLRPSIKVGQNERQESRIGILVQTCWSARNFKLPYQVIQEMFSLLPCMSQDVWFELLERFCLMWDCKVFDKRAMKSLIKQYPGSRIEGENDEKQYMILVVCPELAHISWESLQVLKDHPFVTRMVSLHFLFDQLEKSRKKNGSFPVEIDPEMVKYSRGFTLNSDPEELKVVTRSMTENTILIHQEKRKNTQRVSDLVVQRKMICNAVCCLMESKSVAVEFQGLGNDGFSNVNDYTMRGCPLVVGYLWNCYPEQIDHCTRLLEDSLKRVSRDGSPIHFAQLIHEIRTNKEALHHVSPLISYGLPVVLKPKSKQ